MSVRITKNTNGVWTLDDGTPFQIDLSCWYSIATRVWINPITKLQDQHPDGISPTIEWPPDSQGRKAREWWANGKLHRVDGPAVEKDANSQGVGYRAWLVNGKRHRVDGAAQEYYIDQNGNIGEKRWWINGKECTEEEYESPEILDLRSHLIPVMAKAAKTNEVLSKTNEVLSKTNA